LVAVAVSTLPVAGSICRSMSVTSRPNELALVTTLPPITQL
jgi:hypothetical protein